MTLVSGVLSTSFDASVTVVNLRRPCPPLPALLSLTSGLTCWSDRPCLLRLQSLSWCAGANGHVWDQFGSSAFLPTISLTSLGELNRPGRGLLELLLDIALGYEI